MGAGHGMEAGQAILELKMPNDQLPRKLATRFDRGARI
jgi:hypothetical protein